MDIDGVLIPGRAYFADFQTQPIPTKFDPCVVGMVNRLCAKMGAKLVIHSNWRNTEPRRAAKDLTSLADHFVNEGIRREHLHADVLCPRKMTSTRWHDIQMWLDNHPEVDLTPENERFWILEDTTPPQGWKWTHRVVQTNFDEGLTVAQYMDILESSGHGTSGLLLPGGLLAPGGQ